MTFQHDIPFLAFAYGPQDIVSAVVEAHRNTRTRCLFDLGAADPFSAGMTLLKADAGGDVADIRVSPTALMDDSLEETLRETGVNRIWVELCPVLLERDPSQYLQRIAEMSDRWTVFPVLSDLSLIRVVIDEYPAIANIAIKGVEAAGFVGKESVFTLFSAVRKFLRDRGRRIHVAVAGGIATPEAAAAFLSAGASGILFESVHALTNLLQPQEDRRKKLARMKPEHTDVAGANLGVPVRLYNKGNSKAVKELKDFAGSLCGAEIRDEQRRFFAARIQKDLVDARSAEFSRDELVPLGVEAGFAAAFVRRFGEETEKAVEAFVSETERLCAGASERASCFFGGDAAEALGVRYPFVQGAMSWITDVPEFALEVARAGGLPTVALGLMDRKTLDERLSRLPQVMGEFPYAVNVITLAENPRRAEQLAWIKELRPRFVVIAAGEPSHAREFLQAGIEVIYIAPNEELLRMAFEEGVRWAVCEGNEAGGHVGEHTTLTLAQIVFDYRLRNPDLFKGKRVILAGGVSDARTALMGAMLGADALQMGTAYLATEEIVRAGALTKLYQRMILDAQPGDTTVTGEGTGLRVRSLQTPRIVEICTLERDFAAGSYDEASFRRNIETLAAGSLLVAAKGINAPGGAPLSEKNCLEEGQFMSGACAGVVDKVRSIADFHRELAEGPLEEGLPYVGPIRADARARLTGITIEESAPSTLQGAVSRPSGPQREYERIAITGMSVVNSLGNSPAEVWEACLAMKSGIVNVPLSKWNHAAIFHPRPRMPEKTYCRVGAFQNLELSRKELGIPPQDFRTMTDSTKITMWLALHAIEESGILDSNIPRERIGVLISQNSGEAAVTLKDVLIRGLAKDIVSSVKSVVNLDADAERAVEEAVKAGHLMIDDTTLLGRLNCSAGGFICNKYGFMGPSFSVSAACATALVAMYSAYQMIRNGVIDAAVVGGAEELLTPVHFLEFSALGALAGLSGQERPSQTTSRPFDADRDGMVLGEGGGLVVIERESVAKRRGAKIHAYITAMGASNNNTGMVESSRHTQRIAIERSYADASYGPDQVDMVECHATSTVQGDAEEYHALAGMFSADSPTALTSFKSQIGHTLGASGVNSLIRGVMAMNAGIIPPTLNFEHPDPAIDSRSSGLYIFPQPMEWTSHNGRPRRFQVNAFGFGGSNYVVQVEQAIDDAASVLIDTDSRSEVQAQSVARAGLPEGIAALRTEIGGRPYRVGVVADTEKDAIALIEGVEPLAVGEPISAKRLRALTRQGIFLAPADAPPDPFCFVFPGQGSHYAGMGHELYDTFPVVAEWMDKASKVADFDLLRLLFYDKEEDLQKTRWQQPALFTMEFAIVRLLTTLGMKPVALAGHSLGELTALCLAGVYSFEDGFRIVNKRAICMDKACDMNVDPGVMMAVDAPLDFIKERLSTLSNVYVTNINSPHQIVLGGNTEACKALGAEFKAQGYRSTLLRVSMAFHSPIMECIHDELEAFIADIQFYPPKIPVISNTTMQPFPDDVTEIKKTVMAHLESPVHWMQNVHTLWNDYGVRTFVEVGPRDILSNLIGDCIPEAQCVQTCLPSAECLILRNALAQLYAIGHLQPPSEPKLVSFPGQARKAALSGKSARTSATSPFAVPMGDPLTRIVQREINSFVMESFGRFLKPAILEAVRREYAQNFGEQELDGLLMKVLGRSDFAMPTAAAPPPLRLTQAAAGTVPEEKAAEVAEDQPRTPTEAFESSDVTEAVIHIIMEATGYERDEIEPEMDLREDLSIRSSRLPVIMDSLESHFGIKIEIEDFMEVRTVGDVAQKLSEVVARERRESAAKASPGDAPEKIGEKVNVEAQDKGSVPVKRLTFKEVPLISGASDPVPFLPEDRVAVISIGSGDTLVSETVQALKAVLGITDVATLKAPDGPLSLEAVEEWAEGVEKTFGEGRPPAGLVFVIESLGADIKDAMELAASLSSGLFAVTKAFLDASGRKVAIAVHRASAAEGPERVLLEGALGMFLSMAHEFSSVQFRTVLLDAQTRLQDVLPHIMDMGAKVIETLYREGKPFTTAGTAADAIFDETRANPLDNGDVVVLSGGAYGITFHIARALAAMGCRLVFLGRTKIDPTYDFLKLVKEPGAAQDIAAGAVKAVKGDLAAEDATKEIAKVARCLEMLRNIEELRSLGYDASYYTCDVTDASRLETVTQDIMRRFGRIDGIVHGAGVIRDMFVKLMTPEDFAAVTDVKFRGAMRLYHAMSKCGVKVFLCLSSAAALQGNPGQANYSTANRMMSSLARFLGAKKPDLLSKAVMLPPIEGAGMAENEEIRSMMKRIHASYVHVNELGQLVCRELVAGDPHDAWVLFMRSLPDVKLTRLDFSDAAPNPALFNVLTTGFPRDEYPLIDEVSAVDGVKGGLTAKRTFSHTKDLWLPDHRPFAFMKHPLVSAIMGLEAMMEASRLLWPQLEVIGVRDAKFRDVIECPKDIERHAVVTVVESKPGNREVLCDVTVSSRDISPKGVPMDRSSLNYSATVVLSRVSPDPGAPFPGFPVKPGEIDSRPMDHDEVVSKYDKDDRGAIQGRYRVAEDFDGSGPDCVRGRTVYNPANDFAPPLKTVFQYSPYVFEALMQSGVFHLGMRDENDRKLYIPQRFEELILFRRCDPGEVITVEGRLVRSNAQGVTWRFQASDAKGVPVMRVKDMTFRWFSG